jgi:RNA polymerase sigma factor (sigma-70 family)
LKDLSNEARRRIRRVGAKESVAEGRLDEINELNEPEDESSEPKQVLEAQTASEWLHDLMDRSDIPSQERESFLALREMTSQEAAEKYGRPANQVRQEKFRALKKLRRAVGL